MPKLSGDTLLQQAIGSAVQDRLSLAEAYGNVGEDAEEALAEAKAIKALRGLRLRALSETQRETARLAFVFAEQWETGLADAQAGAQERRASIEAARRFRTFRLQTWGQTEMEHQISQSILVDARSLAQGEVRTVGRGRRPG